MDNAAHANTAQSAERTCPHCGQPIAVKDILCPYCRTVVLAAPEWKPPPIDRTGTSRESRRNHARIGWGLLAANLSAAVLIGLTLLVSRAPTSTSTDVGGILVSSDFVLVPFVMGLVSAFFWKSLTLTTMEYFLYSLLNSACGIVCGGLFMGEGVICLLIVSPLLIAFVFSGALTGRWLFRFNSNRLNFSLIPLALALLTADVLSPHHYENAITDTVVIHAPPALVWSHLAAVPLIPERPNYWLFRLGLPYPTNATVTGQGVGATRQCVFSRHCVFQEKIVAWDPGRRLTFDVTAQPRDPEILGHARVRRGQFLLRDNHDGTTTLIGTS